MAVGGQPFSSPGHAAQVYSSIFERPTSRARVLYDVGTVWQYATRWASKQSQLSQLRQVAARPGSESPGDFSAIHSKQ